MRPASGREAGAEQIPAVQRDGHAAGAEAETVGMMSTWRTRIRPHAGSHRARRIEDERHVKGCFVGEDAVRGLAVLVERFAVVGCDDDERSAGRSGRRSIGPTSVPERRVGGRDLSGIRVVRESRGERFRRRVRESAARTGAPSRTSARPARVPARPVLAPRSRRPTAPARGRPAGRRPTNGRRIRRTRAASPKRALSGNALTNAPVR